MAPVYRRNFDVTLIPTHKHDQLLFSFVFCSLGLLSFHAFEEKSPPGLCPQCMHSNGQQDEQYDRHGIWHQRYISVFLKELRVEHEIEVARLTTERDGALVASAQLNLALQLCSLSAAETEARSGILLEHAMFVAERTRSAFESSQARAATLEGCLDRCISELARRAVVLDQLPTRSQLLEVEEVAHRMAVASAREQSRSEMAMEWSLQLVQARQLRRGSTHKGEE